jgi:hypothetical protein
MNTETVMMEIDREKCTAVQHLCIVKTFQSLGWSGERAQSVTGEVVDLAEERERAAIEQAAKDVAILHINGASEIDKSAAIFAAFAMSGVEIANTIHRRHIAANN